MKFSERPIRFSIAALWIAILASCGDPNHPPDMAAALADMGDAWGASPLDAETADGIGHENTDAIVASDMAQIQAKLSAPLSLATTFQIWQMGVGDFDNDGKPDIVAAGAADGVAAWGTFAAFNLGGRKFRAPSLIASVGGDSSREPRIAVADFNRDGLVDIALHHVNIYTIENLGAQKFAPAKQLPFPFFPGQSLVSFTAADLDHDGNPDLILCGGGGSDAKDPFPTQVFVQFGDGKGGFGAPVGFDADSPVSVTAADLDLDGWADVIAGPMAPGHVLFNDHGKLSPPLDPFGDGIVQTAAADMNGDGLPDIVTPGSVTLNLGHRMLGMTMDSTASFKGISFEEFALGDMNHDGRPDIVFSDGSGGYYVELNEGGGFLADPVMLLKGTNGIALAIADLDGDKKDDLIIGDGKNIAIYFNDSP